MTFLVAAVALVATVVGEAWRMTIPGLVRDAPLSQATVVALALVTSWPSGGTVCGSAASDEAWFTAALSSGCSGATSTCVLASGSRETNIIAPETCVFAAKELVEKSVLAE